METQSTCLQNNILQNLYVLRVAIQELLVAESAFELALVQVYHLGWEAVEVVAK